jgi:hypothetical protein
MFTVHGFEQMAAGCLAWCHFHQYFMSSLFVQKFFCAALMCLQFGFVNFWQKDFGAKAAHKMLVKLAPAWRGGGQQKCTYVLTGFYGSPVYAGHMSYHWIIFCCDEKEIQLILVEVLSIDI